MGRKICIATMCLFFGFFVEAQAASYNYNPLGLLPTTSDLWDINNGSTIIGSSPSYTSHIEEIKEMFGATGSYPESGVALFSDGFSQGFTHWVEWQTLFPIVLTGFNLFAEHDSGGRDINYRGFRTFKLLGKLNPSDTYKEVFFYQVSGDYYNPNEVNYGKHVLYLEVYDIGTSAQYFRAEFVQAGGSYWPGPRVIELDGFGTTYNPPPPPVPIPSAGLLLASGLLGIFGIRRRLTG